MNEVYEFLKKCETYYLATVYENKPKVRPFGTVNIFNDKLYIQTDKKKAVSRELHANANAEICAFDGEKWLRLSGELVEDDDRAARKSMLDAYPDLRALYNEDDGNTEVFYFSNAEATFYSFTAAPRAIKF